MGERTLRYNLINVTTILVTATLFIIDYNNVYEIFQEVDPFHIAIIFLSAILVHTIKAARLYLALYESDITLIDYLKIYCKVTPISVLFPYKAGEFFRMFCYGQYLNNHLKGSIIILLDRFMDTIALVTMILLTWGLNGGHITPFVYALLLFLIFILLVYYIFPGGYKFWKKNLLKSKSTENKLAMLKVLDTLNFVYEEITTVSKGRGIILYIMSLGAWAVEIGSISISSGLFGAIEMNQKVSEYLISAMSNTFSDELRQFVFISVVLMVAIYLGVKVIELLLRKKGY